MFIFLLNTRVWHCEYNAQRLNLYSSFDRVVEDAMSGQYLNSAFALPCPPGIDVPAEIVSPFTSNSLKVRSPGKQTLTP